uniref:HECT-type E3 ubiquitin transferase n=1 Tax=Davidia involucrata TaxID=16924 RepID=A0A5B6ZVH1_DAVIN
MEIRNKKRAEASSAAASTQPLTRSTKRPRLSASSISTETRRSPRLMDSTAESSGSGSRHRSDKGKERESEFRFKGRYMERERQRQREKNIGLSFYSASDDDDDNDDDNYGSDSEGGFGLFHQNLTSAGSALQGLLRKLGAGLDELLPSSALTAATPSLSHQGGRLKKIMSMLRADGEEGRQIEALTQLCDMLSIGTEDSLRAFPVDTFVPVLVELLNYESNADIMLLAARALTHLCDVLPSSCGAVVHYGAVPCFCARLLNIDYVDLAEQSLQALKRISQEHPTVCLRAGGLMAVLSFLDFFSTGVQRVALFTAANMCKKLPLDAADFVMEAMPRLTNLLQHHDSKVLEYASICLIRIAEAFASSPEKLDKLCNHGLVAEAASLISTINSGGGHASLSTSTYTDLVRLLSICASGSPLVATTLLLLGISGILKVALSASGLMGSIFVSSTLTRPPDQIFEIVNLADEILPPLPEETLSLLTCSTFQMKGSIGKKSPACYSGKVEDTNGTSPEVSPCEKIFHDQPDLLQQFGMDLLPILVQIHGSTMNVQVRHKCFFVIGKLMYFCTAHMILSILKETNISSFLAVVLAWKDPQVLIPALQMAETLMEKLPETFSKMFVREGVIHAVDQLIANGFSNTVAAQLYFHEKDGDHGTSASRPRRYWQRIGCSNLGGSSLEESKGPISGNIGPPPASLEIPTRNSSIRDAVSARAKAFKDKYFPSGCGEAEVGVADDLLQLKNLCTKLNLSVDDQKTKAKGRCNASGSHLRNLSSNTEEQAIEVISSMLAELSREDAVSTFEFIGSGVVSALLNYFCWGIYSKVRTSEADLLKLQQKAFRRFRSFIIVALPSSIKESVDTPMICLIRKLQNALSSLERFQVVLSHSSRSSSGNTRLSSGISELSQPLKLRLCRAQGDKSLSDYSSNIVLIDPLVSLAAVEDFLWPRVQQFESGHNVSASGGNLEIRTPFTKAATSSFSNSNPAATTHGHSIRSRLSVTKGGSSIKGPRQEQSGSLLKGKGKAFPRAAQDEVGPQTKTSARRGADSDKDTHMKRLHGGSTSEVLKNDVLVCELEKVHGVEVEDSADDGTVASIESESWANPMSHYSNTTTPFTSRGSVNNTFGSEGAISVAASAAMGGRVSPSGRGFRGVRDQRGLILVGCTKDHPKLIFSAGGRQLNRNMAIYQAVRQQVVLDADNDERYNGEFTSSDGTRPSSDIYTITYQSLDRQVNRTKTENLNSTPADFSKAGSAPNSNTGPYVNPPSLLDSILQGEVPCDLEKTNPTYSILALLRTLESLNQLTQRLRAQIVCDDFSEGKILTLDERNTIGMKVPAEEFINSKLTSKLSRQIQDALALCSGNLPSWCYQLTKACPFLFPFETRRQYFYSTSFGLSRALHRLQQQQGSEGYGSANEREVHIGRLQRQKVRVSRNRILDSAAKVMEMYSSQKFILEIEYFGEVGTGLGPTLEFYTLLSHDLQKVELKIWRSSSISENSAIKIDEHRTECLYSFCSARELGHTASGSGDLVEAPLGLFPRPWPPGTDASGVSQFSKVLEYFQLIGRVIAKALQDGRLLDLPLSMAFYKLVLGQELDLHDILLFDAELGKHLRELQALVYRKRYLDTMAGNNSEAVAGLCFRGALIEDLCLDFSLPGYPDYILKPGADNILVDINNLEEYISLVVDATVKTGIMRQMEAFRAGFNQVFDISSLQIFSPLELDYLLCGRRELWELATLVDHIKFDHGYTAKSPVIVNFLEILGEFTPEQQRAFCQFVTGAPRLPPGGLAALNPKLTIVRKHSSTIMNTAASVTGKSESADDDLPSVMTCANYLKLPPYSTKEIMYKKLLYAINEGQGSFDLS